MTAGLKSRNERVGRLRRSSGFTLVEILVTLALSGLIMVTVYKAMSAQQKVYSVQEQAVDIQDNLRGAMAIIVRDLRLAGCDPLGTAGAGFLAAAAGTLRITMDVTGGEADGSDNDGNGLTDEPMEFADGNTTGIDENVLYARFTDTDGSSSFGRDIGDGQGFIPIARNVDALEFYYTLANGTRTLTPANPGDIRTVQVTILARNAIEDNTFRNSFTYDLPSGNRVGPFNDRFRRRILTTVVRCRNMGFKAQ